VAQELINTNPNDSSFGFNSDNQLASAFFRLAPPGKGLEVYGEYGRDDRNADTRDLLLEPDQISAYMIGIARAWFSPTQNYITVVRGEILNSAISHIQEARRQALWYTHFAQFDGHTNEGQVLGSVGTFGGGAANLSVDRYTPSGRITVRWDRIVRATPRSPQDLPIFGDADVTEALGVERAMFTSRGELTMNASLVADFNRYFAGNALNANFGVGYRLLR
jgi:hypothetical protein